jgi:L-histidine N-alpha-methyltransferase
MRAVARQLSPGDAFLLGLDLVKDEARLHAAYNDAAGVTAAFTLNILRVMNENLGADFDETAFEHVATWDPRRSWIHIRLRATRACWVEVPAAELELSYQVGDEIRTEVSCKYTRSSLERLLEGTGLAVDGWFSDEQELFALALLGPRPSRSS